MVNCGKPFIVGFDGARTHASFDGPSTLLWSTQTMPSKSNSLVSLIDKKLDVTNFREQHWEGSFWDYLDLLMEHPEVARNAFQRLYDMILSYGVESYTQFKQEYNRYKFFADPIDHGADAIYGLERPLMQLVDFFKSAAQGYGTEKRILLLHGPVGSSKSTMARLLKKGLEQYSRTDEGMLFSFSWKGETGAWHKCPMHEDPLHLVPHELRAPLLARLEDQQKSSQYDVTIQGEMCPFCRS